MEGVPSTFLYNSINPTIFSAIDTHSYRWNKPFLVLMVCSLKEYKGVNEYLQIAHKLNGSGDIQFQLIVNAHQQEIDTYFSNEIIPNNLKIFATQNDLNPFYKETNLLMNLSHPETWVETFGLTLLEAMCFGIPVIAPPVGGPAELVDDGENGYLISCYEIGKIADKIVELSKDKELCQRLSNNAKLKAAAFSPAKFESQLLQLINEA